MSKNQQPQMDLNEKFYIFDNFITSNKHSYECIVVIIEKNRDKYFDIFVEANFTKQTDECIFENKLDAYNLLVKDKQNDQFLQWHSNYKPTPKDSLGDTMMIADGDYARILKVVKRK